MSFYESISQLKKMLGNLDALLTKSEAFAKEKSFDPSVLLAARLAPNQWALTRQVQAACDAAKFAAARLAGKEPPKHPDTETTLDDLHKRIAAVTEYLGTFKPADFQGAESRSVALPFLEGKVLTGTDYLNEMVLPNFYFHLTTAFAILRHNGLDIGKQDYIGSLNIH